MDREAFFAELRKRGSGVFGTSLTQGQVEGIDAILSEAERRHTRLADMAYMLATTYHETAHTMQPIFERGKRSYFNKYEPGTRIGKMLGNTKPGDGFRFRGRGFVQLTGRANYVRASQKLGEDFAGNPDLVLLMKFAVPILFDGMRLGWFTGKDLDDYIDGVDEDDKEDLREFANARRIINGTDKALEIGQYALAFEKALKAGCYGIGIELADILDTEWSFPDTPAPAEPVPVPPATSEPPKPEPRPVPSDGTLTGIFLGLLGALALAVTAFWDYVTETLPCDWLGWWCG